MKPANYCKAVKKIKNQNGKSKIVEILHFVGNDNDY
jgi:hypothetical protein